MLNPTHRTSQILLGIVAFTLTSIAASLVSVRGENATTNQTKSQPCDRGVESNQIESFNFLNSENIKFGFIDRDFGFDSYFPSVSERETDYLDATEYSLIEELKISELDRFGDVDSALAQ
jgi:hypothetical protein